MNIVLDVMDKIDSGHTNLVHTKIIQYLNLYNMLKEMWKDFWVKIYFML